MKCREKCGACCVAPSIELPMPNMPAGKSAGVVCVNLDLESLRCKIWGLDNYPKHCAKFLPTKDVCGTNREHALQLITVLERDTNPK